MWARIENNIVREVIDFDPEGKFHPSLIWVECSNDIKEGSSFVDGVFTAPSTTLPEWTVKEVAIAELAASDIKVLRRIEEIALGQTPFLDDAAYTALLQRRQELRAIINS